MIIKCSRFFLQLHKFKTESFINNYSHTTYFIHKSNSYQSTLGQFDKLSLQEYEKEY